MPGGSDVSGWDPDEQGIGTLGGGSASAPAPAPANTTRGGDELNGAMDESAAPPQAASPQADPYELPALPAEHADVLVRGAPATRRETVDIASDRAAQAVRFYNDLMSADGRARWWAANAKGLDPSKEPPKFTDRRNPTQVDPEWTRWNNATKALDAQAAKAATQASQAQNAYQSASNTYNTYLERTARAGIGGARAQLAAETAAARLDFMMGKLDADTAAKLVGDKISEFKGLVSEYNKQIAEAQANHAKDMTTAQAIATAANASVAAAQKQLVPVGSMTNLYGVLNNYAAQHGMAPVDYHEGPPTTLGAIRAEADKGALDSFNKAYQGLPDFNAAAGLTAPTPPTIPDEIKAQYGNPPGLAAAAAAQAAAQAGQPPATPENTGATLQPTTPPAEVPLPGSPIRDVSPGAFGNIAAGLQPNTTEEQAAA